MATFGVVIIVPVLPPGAEVVRRLPRFGNCLCNFYTTQGVVERLAAQDSEVFRLSVFDLMVEPGLSPAATVELQAILPQFTNVVAIELKRIDAPMILRLGEGINCTSFKMGSTVPCRVVLGERVTAAFLGDHVEVAEVVVPPQMRVMEFSMHRDMTVPAETRLLYLKARSTVARVLTIPSTPWRIQYDVSAQVMLRGSGRMSVSVVEYDSDTDSDATQVVDEEVMESGQVEQPPFVVNAAVAGARKRSKSGRTITPPTRYDTGRR